MEKLIQLLQHPFWDTIANFIKKFKSSKSYYSVSYLILVFIIREAIAYKYASRLKFFFETQAQDSNYPIIWDILELIFSGGSLELVWFGTFVFLILSFVKVSESKNNFFFIRENYLSIFLILLVLFVSFYNNDKTKKVIQEESNTTRELIKSEAEKTRKIISQKTFHIKIIKSSLVNNKPIIGAKFYKNEECDKHIFSPYKDKRYFISEEGIKNFLYMYHKEHGCVEIKLTDNPYPNFKCSIDCNNEDNIEQYKFCKKQKFKSKPVCEDYNE